MCMTVLYILYYILAYIQHNGDVSLENQKKKVLCYMLYVSVYINLQSGRMLCLRGTIYLAIIPYILVPNCYENILGFLSLAKFPVRNLKFKNLNLERNVSTPTSCILLYGFREIFFFLLNFSPLVSASCCVASHRAMMIPVRSHCGQAFP